ncbi:basic proline-rich protein-like [Phocoena phocoena]|uniref:basic proline-rich protein-like n=1 Tax=Phocoena phocoena TaxID=9742 RepID=UPI003306CECB
MPGGNLSIRGGPRRGCGATGPAPDRGPRPPPETLAPNSRPRDPLLAKPARDPGLETLAPETPAPEPQALRPQSYEPGPRDPSPATPGADPGDMGTPTPASQRPSAFSLRAPGDPCPAEVPARPGRPRLASGTTVPGKREPPEARQDAGPEKGGSEGEGVRRPGSEPASRSPAPGSAPATRPLPPAGRPARRLRAPPAACARAHTHPSTRLPPGPRLRTRPARPAAPPSPPARPPFGLRPVACPRLRTRSRSGPAPPTGPSTRGPASYHAQARGPAPAAYRGASGFGFLKGGRGLGYSTDSGCPQKPKVVSGH